MFIEMREQLVENFNNLARDANAIFEVEVDKDEMWNIYLDSFPIGKNLIYKVNREHDCSCCRHFVKSIGNVVFIKGGKLISIWDFEPTDDTYKPVVKALSEYVKRHTVSDVYISNENFIGAATTHEMLETGIKSWNHFYIELPNKFVKSNSRSVADIKGDYRDTRNVFKRSLDEISLDAIDTILELISTNTLYRGSEWSNALTEFRKYKVKYDRITDETEKNNCVWEWSITAGNVIGRIRNHSIGTLLVNVSDGMELDTAVRKYEQIVAPQNYKRPKEIYTKKMLEDAKKTIESMGYMDSLERRYATLDDITVNNILFSNKDSAKRINGALSVFDRMERNVVTNPKKFSKVEEIQIDDFIKNVVPTANEIELYLENRHTRNMVSLIAPTVKDSKTMFKWNNNFSWAYSGNVADSMKERVKEFGGKVDGDLRFSIQWNEDGNDECDLDAHCIEADGSEIYYGSYKAPYKSHSGGQLDVDIIHPHGKTAVENIVYDNRKKMKCGTYSFYVRQYSGSAKHGFRAEIEFDGNIYSFDYDNTMRTGQDVDVADVTLHEDGTFTITEKIKSNASQKEVWNVTTNTFIPVSVLCYSPNWWDDNTGNGNKHYFFMLKDCISDEMHNGMFNEYLKQELLEHKRVFATLGSMMKVEDSDDQLSGVGFSSTMRNDVIVKVRANTEKTFTERIFRIKF